MTPRLIKLVASSFGVGGAVIVGYYAVEELTNERIPVIVRNTIEKKLKLEKQKPLWLEEAKWQEKFNEFKKGDKLSKLAKVLKAEKNSEFVVTKNDENAEGGKALKNWCSKVLDLELEKVTDNETYENAKELCSEKIAE